MKRNRRGRGEFGAWGKSIGWERRKRRSLGRKKGTKSEEGEEEEKIIEKEADDQE